MHFHHNTIAFSPSDIVRFFESEFASYMNHFEKLISKEVQKELDVHRDPSDPLLDLIRDMGNQHEEDIINKIEKTDSVLRIEKDKQNRDASIKRTLLAMKKGEEKIYQAAIKKDMIFGYADLLVKNQGRSKLGDYHYIPYDFKIARHPKPTALIQLCCYCDILESIQGLLPPTFVVITKDETPHFFKTTSFFYLYQFLKEKFLSYHSSFSEHHIPIPDKKAEHRDWSSFARKRLHVLDDISLVAGIRSAHSLLLRREGIKKLSELPYHKTDINPIKGIPATTLGILKDQASIQLSSKEKKKPDFKVLSHTGKRQGLEMLPPPHPADIFFDMEGYPLLGTEGLEYLYGNTINEDPQYICFWAMNEKEEVSAFKKWLDWAYQRWQENPGIHIYHYGHYEPSTIKKLMGKYGTGEQEVDNLLRHQVFVDLYRIVTQGLRIGTFSYSLKDVEQLYYEKRDTSVKSGGQAAFYFFHFLNSTATTENSPFLQKIKSYNQDDCFSTQKLCEFLWDLQRKHKIKYIDYFEESQEEKHRRSNPKEECYNKAQALLNQIPVQKRFKHLYQMEEEKEIYIAGLLAHLLEFHIREDKPGWWDYFSRMDMNEEEMLEDRNTITSCRLIKPQYNNHNIKFEKEQEIGFQEGDKVLILENNIWDTYTILDLNLIEGSLHLKPNKENNILQRKIFTLVPEKNDYYKKNLFSSLLATANDFSPHSPPLFGLKKCIHDLLLRKAPDLPNHKGALIVNKDKIIEEVSTHVCNLNNSVFCIQGPPGSGKTYTAAHIILHLVKKGKRVGITANSHKAISNILKTIHEQNKEKFIFQCQKVRDSRNPTEEQISLQHIPIELVNSNQINRSAKIVGGTTFFFSRNREEEAYDYLFVDEASQVSLTNMVAAARTTKNIILIGDQNQLDQPIQASHPAESGYSALTYYTDRNTTISEDKGVFLPLSYRMHPSICQFISDHFYNGKLTYHPTTARQKILLPNSLRETALPVNTKIQPLFHCTSGLPESGLHFIPVEHSGNVHSSKEEARVIAYLYKELLKAKWINRKGDTAPITSKDILIVAPYNFQVACLKKTLSTEAARIASVDKFQGQEAPICILSLAASTIQDAPRGISFLLNKNRLNVALSRARCLSIIVGSKNLTDINISSIPNMELMNIWCQITRNTLDK